MIEMVETVEMVEMVEKVEMVEMVEKVLPGFCRFSPSESSARAGSDCRRNLLRRIPLLAFTTSTK
jgi:hypothetical protein